MLKPCGKAEMSKDVKKQFSMQLLKWDPKTIAPGREGNKTGSILRKKLYSKITQPIMQREMLEVWMNGSS
jgi:hypothetical protein